MKKAVGNWSSTESRKRREEGIEGNQRPETESQELKERKDNVHGRPQLVLPWQLSGPC